MTKHESQPTVLVLRVQAGDRVRIVRSFWWPGMITTVSEVRRDAWGLVTGIGVDVGRDDGPAFFRPEDLEVVT